jgi:hypothetical protein
VCNEKKAKGIERKVMEKHAEKIFKGMKRTDEGTRQRQGKVRVRVKDRVSVRRRVRETQT